MWTDHFWQARNTYGLSKHARAQGIDIFILLSALTEIYCWRRLWKRRCQWLPRRTQTSFEKPSYLILSYAHTVNRRSRFGLAGEGGENKNRFDRRMNNNSPCISQPTTATTLGGGGGAAHRGLPWCMVEKRNQIFECPRLGGRPFTDSGGGTRQVAKQCRSVMP